MSFDSKLIADKYDWIGRNKHNLVIPPNKAGESLKYSYHKLIWIYYHFINLIIALSLFTLLTGLFSLFFHQFILTFSANSLFLSNFMSLYNCDLTTDILIRSQGLINQELFIGVI